MCAVRLVHARGVTVLPDGAINKGERLWGRSPRISPSCCCSLPLVAIALPWTGTAACHAEWGRFVGKSAVRLSRTDYYRSSMGEQLQKTFFTFQQPVDPADLPRWKTQTNAWELEYAQAAGHPEPRPLNLDPATVAGQVGFGLHQRSCASHLFARWNFCGD